MAVIGVTVMSNGVVSGSTTVSESKGGFAAHSIQVRFKDVSGYSTLPTKEDENSPEVRAHRKHPVLQLHPRPEHSRAQHSLLRLGNHRRLMVVA